ncbi:hypothetical protein ACFQ51_22700 [Streptomyces kaempferi]
MTSAQEAASTGRSCAIALATACSQSSQPDPSLSIRAAAAWKRAWTTTPASPKRSPRAIAFSACAAVTATASCS